MDLGQKFRSKICAPTASGRAHLNIVILKLLVGSLAQLSPVRGVAVVSKHVSYQGKYAYFDQREQIQQSSCQCGNASKVFVWITTARDWLAIVVHSASPL
ncbi:hypothetical protein OOU_Y34scaffold00224g25 [Pyricularia oryzae Y34]|uniref:Uncharacterized protein n=2 Tax=Pyricularia oryzae TaxID=318829 RepID=A0AA97PPF1_PYRO3|nr:hypothetical protein OOU_Y34scaffold00224g25 [Pyricularia oryzae Y34]